VALAAKKPSRQATWIEVAVKNAGFRKALTALTWAYSWAIVRESIGHEPSVDEVAEWWNENRRTAFREQSAFRLAFPTLETPAQLFQSPVMKTKIAEAARFGERIDGSLARKRSKPETSILELGMSPATL
jgi:hypothetical protein